MSEINKNILLEQYKLYVEMADRISQRRQSANNYFLSLNLLLFSFFSYMTYIKKEFEMGIFVISVAGIISCWIWYRLIKSYKGLNSAKFKVVHDMEKMLGYQPYDKEWEKLGRGKDKSLYLPFTKIELYIPCIIKGMHIFVLLYSVYLYFF